MAAGRVGKPGLSKILVITARPARTCAPLSRSDPLERSHVLTTAAWGQLYYPGLVAGDAMPASVMNMDFDENRFKVAKKGVTRYEDIENAEVTPTTDSGLWPGDYFPDDAEHHFGGTVEAIMSRMKHSFSNSTEMLSSAVAWWVGPAYVATGQVEGLYFPGLTGVDYAGALN